MISVFVILAVFVEIGTRILIYKKYGHSTKGRSWRVRYESYLLFKWDNRMHIPYPPKEDKYRILILGGSTAAFVPNQIVEETFQKVVNKKVEVINLAMPGYIVNQEAIMLILYGVKLDPDLVITLDGANDIVCVTKKMKAGIVYQNKFIELAMYHPFQNMIFTILRRSQFINSINILKERRIEKSVQLDSNYVNATLDHLVGSLNSISVITKGLGVPYIMVLQPYIHLKESITKQEKTDPSTMSHLYRKSFMIVTFNKLDKRMSNHHLMGEVYYVNGSNAFDNETCFTDEVHLTKHGNRLLCQYILKIAMASGFYSKPLEN